MTVNNCLDKIIKVQIETIKFKKAVSESLLPFFVIARFFVQGKKIP